MPYKHNEDRRHHIPKMAFKVQNWPEYEAGLRRRGSLTLWIDDAALDHWQTFRPGGQQRAAHRIFSLMCTSSGISTESLIIDIPVSVSVDNPIASISTAACS